MNLKTNHLPLWLISFSLFMVISSCKNQPETTGGGAKEPSLTDQSFDKESKESDDEAKKIFGMPIDSAKAIKITGQYVATLNSSTANNDAKSVYFSKTELDIFTNRILQANLCTQDKIGYRLYFAKYDNTDSPDFPGQNTIVIRATCDGRDIAHQYDQGGLETVKVAYDFGDICPPRCDPNNQSTIYSDGRYRGKGVCYGCPQ